MEINFILFCILVSIKSYTQIMTLETLENKLGTEIPHDYLTFRETELKNEIN